MSVTSGTKSESGLGETIRVVIHALLIALVIRTFLFQPFNIPSGSMKATLLVGDYLFVSKYSYGYSHYSIPLSPPLFSGRAFGMTRSAFEPLPELTKDLAKAVMWTYHGREFPAPTFELGMAPAGSMYTTVTDLARFLSILFAGGRGPISGSVRVGGDRSGEAVERNAAERRQL